MSLPSALPAAKALARPPLTALNRPVATARLRRLVADTPPPYRILLGAGPATRPGWINTDVSFRAKYWLDATREWPFPAGTVSHVYADNMIEHLTLSGARSFLRCARAAMMPGGVIRLVTPDVEACARIYLGGAEAQERHLARQRRHGYLAEHPVDILRLIFTESGHHAGYLWDEAAMRAELAAAAFAGIQRFGVDESDDEALRGLEHRTSAEEAATSLVIEASVPD